MTVFTYYYEREEEVNTQGVSFALSLAHLDNKEIQI